uniref:Uncharacterized protein n=1 Tax=Tanacetum cinerariifolium TaxID=118510 RepID=A0A6L2P4D0_TANCI|nr:hypothetical protein [Tanacetum cinerariifolium]
MYRCYHTINPPHFLMENKNGALCLAGEKWLDVGYALPPVWNVWPVVKRQEQGTEEWSCRRVSGFSGELCIQKPIDFWCTMKVFKLDANANGCGCL